MRDPGFSLRQVQYAVAVDDCRGFRKAAELCHVAQPALSQQLAKLEDTLGVTLFERSRDVLPTRAGVQLLERMRRLLLEAQDVAAAAQGLRDPLRGRLRVGVIQTVAPYLLADLAPAVHRAFPDLELLWTSGRTATLAEDLKLGRLDAMLVALDTEIGDVEHQVVVEDAFVLALAPDHPLVAALDDPADVSLLAGHAVHLLEDGHCFGDQAASLCTAVGAVEAAFRATDLTTLVQMVLCSAGATVLPSMAVDIENRRHELVLRPFAPGGPSRTIALAWRPGSPMIGAMREVAAVMQAAVATPPGRSRPR